MPRRRTPKASDSISLAKPSTTAPHLQRGRPTPLRAGGLHDIATTNVSAHGKVLISPVPNAAELAARRQSERLEIASSDTPVRNSTMRGPAYTCPELRTNPPRPGSADAFRLPSRTSFNKG
jgi:hypothetical protein